MDVSVLAEVHDHVGRAAAGAEVVQVANLHLLVWHPWQVGEHRARPAGAKVDEVDADLAEADHHEARAIVGDRAGGVLVHPARDEALLGTPSHGVPNRPGLVAAYRAPIWICCRIQVTT